MKSKLSTFSLRQFLVITVLGLWMARWAPGWWLAAQLLPFTANASPGVV